MATDILTPTLSADPIGEINKYDFHTDSKPVFRARKGLDADIVTQISAVRAALRAVEEEILSDHVANCVEHAIASGNKAEQRRKVAELMDVLSRAAR